VPLAVRIGLSAGDVSFEDDDVHGTPVIEAARLCAAAVHGEGVRLPGHHATDLSKALRIGGGRPSV
jgi:class 3 adenylate cyclase